MTAEPPAEIDADAVGRYLAANPGFLAARPALFATLDPPRRVHGAVLADHMGEMIRAARAHAAARDAQAEQVLAAGRACASLADRVQEAVLAVLRSPDIAECVAETWPGLLGVDAAVLCCEADRPRMAVSLYDKNEPGKAAPACETARSRWRTLPGGAVRTLLRGRAVVFRDRPADAALLHAEAALLAERDLLVHIPGPRAALLALVSRDPACLPMTQGWAFLGRALGALTGGG